MTFTAISKRVRAIPVSGSARGNALSMAGGTLLSRMTGVARIIALAYALGLHVGDAFNLANNTPNTLYDLLLGGILASTIVPVFSSRLTTESETRAWRSISSIFTLTCISLMIATVLFELASPLIIHAYAIYSHGSASSEEVRLAINLLRLFAPQLFFYGFISVASATLYSRGHFAAPAFTPILNNIIAIAVLLVFANFYPHPSVTSVLNNSSALWLLGIGSTAGVAIQAIGLIPSLIKYAPHLRVRLQYRDPAIREIIRLSGWTLGYVLANQLALFVVTALAFSHRGFVTAYNYAYLFFQLPYAIVSLSIMSAVQPQLAALWATNRSRDFSLRLSSSLKTSVTITIPFAILYLIGSALAVRIVLLHGAMGTNGASLTSSALVGFAFGLPGFAAFLSINQAIQSMKDARAVFTLYAIENSLNIVCALILVRTNGVFGLALAFSIAYDVAAVVGLWVLRTKGVHLLYRDIAKSWINSTVASLVGAGLALPLTRLGVHASGLVALLYGIGVGGVFAGGFLASAAIGSRLTGRRRRGNLP
ncbi:MAG: murein biosynthesis integral membrane protein MurJ [Acidimicrobiales bacterium]